MEEDAASEISDWEVLSAASACGVGADDEDVAFVSGGGVDVVHDHFAAAPASPDAGFSGEGSWTELVVAPDEGDRREDFELLDEFDSISQESFDLPAGDWSVQLQAVPVDRTRESSVPEGSVPCRATWSADGGQAEAVYAEKDVANSCDELGSMLHPAPQHLGVGETLDSDATTATVTPPSEASENSNVQLDDGGVEVGTEVSCVEDVATSDELQGEQGEQELGNNASAASGCGDGPDGEAKDGSLPLVPTPISNEGEGQVAVWWRLPFKLLHYCAWKVKPVWSFSIAAALLGLAVLGRRMYRMRRKARGLPQIKIAFDDKRASQFADRASRLNEAFLIARRVPMLRTSSGAVLPWSMVQER
ncbi:hypothetical protein ACP70R_026820 [Stipagrostis hirtigluma subsp. patula]